MVERYIPQTLLLGRCDAVVSHAGSGTFLAALAQGLPQVCLPQAADQFRNAVHCADSGAGIDVGPGAKDGEVIGAAVTRVLTDSSFRRAAETIRDDIVAMPSPEDVADLLVYVS